MKIKNPKSFWAGLMFIAFGLFFLAWSQLHYEMGSARRMGPAYFPSVLGALLAALGVLVVASALTVHGSKVARFHFRPLILILLSCIAFGYLLNPLGLVGAIVALVVIGALGGHEFRWNEVAILSLVLVVFSVLVFVKGLTLPFPIWPEFLQ